MEEEFWWRKSRINWLKEGDRNIKYFHATTAERRKRNRVEMIKTDGGIEYREDRENVGKIVNYFEKLFTSDHPQDCDEILERIPRTITEQMNRILTRTVENQEIKKTLSQ